jgi:hypothetical protein
MPANKSIKRSFREMDAPRKHTPSYCNLLAAMLALLDTLAASAQQPVLSLPDRKILSDPARTSQPVTADSPALLPPLSIFSGAPLLTHITQDAAAPAGVGVIEKQESARPTIDTYVDTLRNYAVRTP